MMQRHQTHDGQGYRKKRTHRAPDPRPEGKREQHDYRLKPRAVAASFHYFARRALKQEHDVLE
jgi:hypothetical protein